jgi:hypothetical protein
MTDGHNQNLAPKMTVQTKHKIKFAFTLIS